MALELTADVSILGQTAQEPIVGGSVRLPAQAYGVVTHFWASGLLIANIPVAPGELDSGLRRYSVDLSAATQVRLLALVSTVANAGASVLPVLFTPAPLAWVCPIPNFTPISTLGLNDGGWTDLDPYIRINNVFGTVFSNGGDGAADPVLSIFLQFR